MLFQNSQPQDSGRKDNTKGALAEADAHFQYSGQAEAGTKKKKPRAASDTQGFYRNGAHPLLQGGVGCASIKSTIGEWVPDDERSGRN
jgi:hypothetical protein